ncbi:hypothetical protein B2M20_13115 [Nitrobacter vulgaris]|uniref:Uncharacterized protein n=2 Tax=Nitrobacter vulgaris TaxID=29421 RepID=A0A1V4HX11_NITVU|nr:hypothetical protein B2M20_13115 [Nitrobacter vulgaris]
MTHEPDDELIFVSNRADTPCHAAVGHAASAWSWFEHMVDLTIAKLADEKIEVALALIAQIGSIHAKFDALIAILQRAEYSGVSPRTIKKLIRFSNEVRPLTIRRNRIIHDPVVLEHGEPKTVRLTTKGANGKLVYTLEKFDMAEVGDFIAKVHDRTVEFKKLRNEIREALAAKPHGMQTAERPAE